MKDNKVLFVESLGRSIHKSVGTIISTLNSIVDKGVMYCKVEINEDLDADKYPFRMLYHPPSPPEEPTVLSCGPFALDAKYYKGIMNSDLDDEAKIYLFSMHRLIFENTGFLGIGEVWLTTDVDENDFYDAIAFSSMWDVLNGIEIGNVVWIEPKDEVRKAVEKITGKKFDSDSFAWWNECIKFGEKWGIDKSQYEKNNLVRFHENIHKWMPFLPHTTGIVLFCLLTSDFNIDSKLGYSKPRIVKKIKEIIENLSLEDPNNFDPDRELLIYEILSYNQIDYPIDEFDHYDLFISIKAIKETHKKGKFCVVADSSMLEPTNLLRIPSKWNQKMNNYVVTGSILFAYCSIEDIVN